ncbi:MULTISPECIES: hypothetical protein [unclassified Variovorax]|jgi:drug/metabolite transporter (DMT)-like permease|uniref:hypothetical protein n=1 Tax=unclassified Variovorax TaxID=663243 RepID=UPI000F7D776F|nr:MULTISPECIES: hypothetical protein [unclassified Variovorax]RSZ31450.1 hypothetical protein EJO70_31325 [Variovorax sp. 553]RSZ31800.1 hypothetical protein EJO71_31330 [Variovorax sp. 679]
MRTPFLRESSPDEPPALQRRSACMAWLPVLLCIVAAVGFVLVAVFVQNIVAASMFTTAAIVFLGIGLLLGLSMWVFPDLPR